MLGSLWNFWKFQEPKLEFKSLKLCPGIGLGNNLLQESVAIDNVTGTTNINRM